MQKLIITILLLGSLRLTANNISVSNVSTSGQVSVSGYTFVEFDLNWDNSWRTSAGPSNWDAAWVFVKYQVVGGTGCTVGDWSHATLSATSSHHSVTTTNGVTETIDVASDGVGAFLYRSTDGSGAIDWDDVLLRWEYGADGLTDDCEVTIKVFAIEMAYVTESNFFLGSGGTASAEFEDGVSGVPLLITSDGSITLGGGASGSLGNNNTFDQTGGVDDFDDVNSQTLPAAFPIGYNAFYCMKHEITNQQYAEFLNTLTAIQQETRASTTTAGNYHGDSASPLIRSGLKCQTAPSGGVAGQYGCDLDEDDEYDEAGSDGLSIALGRLSWPDIAGYLDWSGLRPMTETELEKACRGDQMPVADEYAWGTSSIHTSSYSTLTGSGSDSELPNSPSYTVGNAVYSTTFSTGPLRSGIFATSSSTRVISGATYYGILDITGNVWEDAVNLGSNAGRSYTGLHGDGTLNSSGDADTDFWPGINGNTTRSVANTVYGGTTGVTGSAGAGFHAGTFNSTVWLRVSDRRHAYWGGLTTRDERNGGRGVRTAP